MGAGFVAGFLMVIFTFGHALFSVGVLEGKITGDPLKDGLIMLSILFNICFFYAFGIVVEQDPEYHKFIRQRGKPEWFLRVFSNVALLAVPIFLEDGIFPFSVSLITFYILLIFWDVVVFARRPVAAEGETRSAANPIWWDVAGFFLAVILLFILNYPPVDLYLLGMVTVLFAVIAGRGVYVAGRHFRHVFSQPLV